MRALRQEENYRILLFGLLAFFVISMSLALVMDNTILLCLPFAVILLIASINNIQLIFLLLLFIIPFSTEQKVTGSLSTDFPDELLMWLITGIILLVSIFKKGTIRTIISNDHPLFRILFLSLAWICITTLFSANFLISFKHLLSKFWYLCTFFFLPIILFSKPQHIKRIAQVLIVGMLCIVLYSTFRQIEIGFSFLRVNETVRPFFRNHVNYSALLACIIPIVFIGINQTKHKITRTILFLILSICFVNLIFTYSRGAWLGLLCCPLFYFLLKKKKLVKFIIGLFSIMALSLFLIISTGVYKKLTPTKEKTIYHTDFKEHMAATYKFTDMSFAERLHRWIAGIRMTKAKPMFGFGPNTFSTNYKAYTLWEFETWVSANKEKTSIHNYYLLQFSEQGVLGGCLFLGLLYFAFLKTEKLYHNNRKSIKAYTLGIGCTLTIICVELLVNDLIETDKIGSIFFLCLASIIILDKHSTKPSSTDFK